MMDGMKRLFSKISYFLIIALLTFGCVPDIFVKPFESNKEGNLIDYTISFGTPQGENVTISTKGDLGIVRESSVFNLYLLIFDSGGEKVYGHYFNGDNLNASAQSNWWTVSNLTSSAGATTGTLHIKTSKQTGCTIVAVANLNPNDLDVSSGSLSTITTYSELQGIVATQIRSEVTANSGYFLMTAQVDGVNITGGASDNYSDPSKTLKLERIYAKVTFNVRVANKNTVTYNGQPTKINSFVPDKWQVINVPTCSYLLERKLPAVDAADTSDEFFPTDSTGFEIETLSSVANDYYVGTEKPVSIHSFTFYMMENRKNPSSGMSGYADREKQVSGTDPKRAFTYANQYSTYVILTGKLTMDNITNGGNANATLEATVKYKIHLGDFTSDFKDFYTERNHNYIYNISIYGVDDIRAEVISGTENEPGATGTVLVADEKIYTSDCHYSTQVISFHANNLSDSDNITWYVETPFNPDGIQYRDNPSNLGSIDYKWIEFRLNDKENGLYNQKRQLYYPHDYDWDTYAPDIPDDKKTMYVNELVDYLKDQKRKYNDDPTTSVFDSEQKISFTAFVNEFYYTKNPLSDRWDPSLWKDYIVNQPMRKMHIMASCKTSPDGESKVIGSSFTIQQRSIQSIYAIQESADLESAWGMEFIDDFDDETGSGATYWRNNAPAEDCGNTSPTNGRLNTMKIWGIKDKNGNDKSGERLRWDTYLDLSAENETAQLWKGQAGHGNYYYLRYSCMSRNRDNNGDGYIDPDEIRWYMASDIQLIGIFLGSYGIEGAARLYQRSAIEQNSSDKNVWRQHVIASNIYQPGTYTDSNKYARVIWAEEGINGTSIKYSGDDQTATFSTRCVRNMGYYTDEGVRKDITDSDAKYIQPDNYIKVTRKLHVDDGEDISPFNGGYDDSTKDNIYYEFDCTRINLASLRDRIDHELVGHDENSRMACLSKNGFVTAPLSSSVDISGKSSYSFNNKTYNLTTYQGLNDYLDDSFGGMDSNFSICPEGYRLPNVRELSIIWNILSNFITSDTGYLGSGDSDSVPSRTHWSMGKAGDNTKVNDYWGWGMINSKLLMSKNSHKIQKPRCVKDL